MTIGEHVDIFQPSANGQFVLNIPALTTLVSWAEGDEALAERFGTWDQGHWAKVLLGEGLGDQIEQTDVYEQTRNGVCNSAYCMAGQTVVQAGYRLIYNHIGSNHGQEEYQTAECVKTEYIGKGADGKPRFRETGDRMSISVAAARVLGLDWREADALFDGDNGINDLKALINAMCKRRGMPPVFVDVDESEFQEDTDGYLSDLEYYAIGATD